MVMPVVKDAGGGGTAAAILKMTNYNNGAQLSSSSKTYSESRRCKTVTLGDQESILRVNCFRSNFPDLPLASQLFAGSVRVRKKVRSVV